MNLFVLLLFVSSIKVRAEERSPLILAHRGSPCRYPEETLEGYKHAIELRVNFIELDVVSTRDNILIAHHDIFLNSTTNIEDKTKFKHRVDTKSVKDTNVTAYFAMDFTSSEIKQLRARQRLNFRDQSLNDQFEIPTLKEILNLIKESRGAGKEVGAYIETKQSDFHIKNKLPLEHRLIEDLKESGLLREPGAIILQSFSLSSLQKLHRLLAQENVFIPMTWLLDCSDPVPSKKQLENFAKFGQTLGVNKHMLVLIDDKAIECDRKKAQTCSEVLPKQTCTGRLNKTKEGEIQVMPLVSHARELNLTLHAYTFRNEERFMALDFLSDPITELEFFTGNGIDIDGVFVDCPETVLNINSFALSPLVQPTSETDHCSSKKPLIIAVILLTIMLAACLSVLVWILYKARNKDGSTFRFTELIRQMASRYDLRYIRMLLAENTMSPERATEVLTSTKKQQWKLFARVVGIVVLVSIIVLAFTVFDAHKRLEDFLEWVDEHETLGFFIFVFVYALAAVLFFPGSVLSLGAGYVFGIIRGAIAVWFGAVIGQTLGFLLGRYLFREWVSSYASRFKIWRGLELAIKEEGWKIVSLLRLAPLVPYTALNYALGITAVTFIEYFIASALFIIPGVFLFVYLGTLANDIQEISSGDSGIDGTTTIIIAVVTGIVIVLVVIFTSRYAKRALDKLVKEENEEEESHIELNEESNQQTTQV